MRFFPVNSLELKIMFVFFIFFLFKAIAVHQKSTVKQMIKVRVKARNLACSKHVLAVETKGCKVSE